jgi:hypothetical protein
MRSVQPGLAPLPQAARSRDTLGTKPKYVLFAVLGLMTLFVLWNNERFPPGNSMAAGRLLGRPRRLPCALARCSPAMTRSRMRSRSNSASAARMWS